MAKHGGPGWNKIDQVATKLRYWSD